MNLLIKHLLLICTVSFSIAHAQPGSIYFDRITTQNGLSHNKVNCIIQDSRGFTWIGTEDGLNRFDGHNFVVYRNQPGSTIGISGNLIKDVYEDKDGVLWIATGDGGLTSYDYRLPLRQQFHQYKHNPNDSSSIPSNIVNSIVEDSAGYLWVGTSGYSVLRFNKKTASFDKPVQEGTKTILDLVLDKNHILWAGRQGGGLLKVNPANLSYEMDRRYFDLYAKKLPHAAVTALFRDSDDNIWFGSWDKLLYKYDFADNKEYAFGEGSDGSSFPSDEVLCFGEDRSRKLWMGTRRSGLVIFDKKRNRFSNYRHDPARDGTIADNQVNCIYINKLGTVWIGTNKGISVSNPQQQQFSQTFLDIKDDGSRSETIIYDFYQDEDDNLWIGTSEGIFFRARGSDQLQHKPLFYKGNKLTVSKFFRDNGTFYLGTDYSLFIYDPYKHSVQILPNTDKDRVMNKMIDSRIVSIVKDSIDGEPVLLVSPYGHFLTYYDLKNKRWISRLDSTRNIITSFNLKDNLIRKIYKAPSGQIWLATTKEGLGEWVEHSLPKVEYLKNLPFERSGIGNNHVFDICGDERGNLWISTYGGGLHYFNVHTKKFVHIPAANNLLEGLQVDNKGNVWMISNGHLHCYDPRARAFNSFELPDVEKSGGVRGYIYKDSNGNMYVAGTNYFISFNPSSIQMLRTDPKVYFTDFKIFNQSFSHLLFQNRISLRYNQNYFTIEFAAPDFGPSPVHYSYMLEGWDKDWVYSSTRNFTQYSNLDGGNYVFKVRATNNLGMWRTEVASIPIEIIPPFWKTAWFYALCAAVVSLIVYAVYRYRINELLKRQAIRNRIAQDLHDNVGSTLSSVAVFSQVAQIQNEQGNRQELQDVLQRISTTSNDMISEMNDIVWAINPRNDSMQKILQRMESFARPLTSAKNIQFNFHYESTVTHLNLEMEKRKNLYLIFKESVNNSIKYSGCKKLDVNITLKHNWLDMQVGDDGQGFEMTKIKSHAAQSMSGNGLRNMEIRAKEMKGSLTLNSRKGEGTTINLRFPIT